MQAERGADQALIAAALFNKPNVLAYARESIRRAVAVRRLVAQSAAQADFAERLLNAIQASRARIRARMMIDHRAHAGFLRIDEAHQRAVINVVLIQRAVESPPQFLEDVRKILGCRTSSRNCGGD